MLTFEIASNEQLREIINEIDSLQSILFDALPEDEFDEAYKPLSDIRNRATTVLTRRERQALEKNMAAFGETQQ